MPEALPITSHPPRRRSPAYQQCRVCHRKAAAVPMWADRDLCDGCHGPTHPTRRQRAELDRIEARHGLVEVRRAADPGCLLVWLGQKRLTMDPLGRLH